MKRRKIGIGRREVSKVGVVLKLKFTYAKKEEMRDVAVAYNEFLFALKKSTEVEDAYFGFSNLDVDNRRELLLERLEKDRGKVIIVRDEDGSDDIIAFISYSIIECFLVVSPIREIGYIDGAYVRDEYRKEGILKKLDSMVVEDLRNMGIKYLELNTLVDNVKANDAWFSLGYRVFRKQWRKDIE